MKKYLEENKKMVIIIAVFVIFLIILTIIVNSLKPNNKVLITSYVTRLKKDDITLNDNSCDLDYVLEYNKIPYFNLNNETYNKINNEIIYDFLLRACYQDGEIDYEAYLNDNILSVLLNISYETDDDMAYLEYKTYNIDINKHELVSNIDILNKYNVTLNDVVSTVLKRFQEFYEYEYTNNWLDNTITFNDYLEILGYKGITLDDLKLFIDKNNDLNLTYEYELSEGMRRDEGYPNLSIKFKLT